MEGVERKRQGQVHQNPLLGRPLGRSGELLRLTRTIGIGDALTERRGRSRDAGVKLRGEKPRRTATFTPKLPLRDALIDVLVDISQQGSR